MSEQREDLAQETVSGPPGEAPARGGTASRRGLLGAALLAAAAPGAVRAAGYPDHPIRLVVAFPPGGITDLCARVVAQRMGAILGQPVVVENRSGGGGRIGAELVARAPRDGYTLLFADSNTHGTLSTIARDLPFDPMRDFAPIGPVADFPNMLVCNPRLPFRTLPEMIAQLRRQPGSVRRASSGPGTGNHFAGELFDELAGVRTEHVPYRGAAPAVQDVISGTIECAFTGAAYPQVTAGEVRAIATTGATRDPRIPDVPTMAEGGVAGYDMSFWHGMAAPAGTPAEVLAVLGGALRRALEDPGVRDRLYEIGLNLHPGGPEELAAMMRRDIARYREIADKAGLRFD
ncbi:Bug family tripartite tricarboxylate transporter substrate binding protein [Roseomonas sp. BN140053]|uniref:Bug family tripartite tricarboxylate transporter substrate binding protein n=1 Tax=Roseomonas sp. BN140053 TaxID=3391898 RepID=UPI0039EB2714